MVLQGAGKSIGSWKQQCKLGFLSIVALRVPSSGLCTQELLARFPLHFSLSSISDDEQPITMEIIYFFYKGKIENALLFAVGRDVLVYKESCVGMSWWICLPTLRRYVLVNMWFAVLWGCWSCSYGDVSVNMRFPLHFSLSSIGDDEQPTTIEINYFFCKLEGACAPIAPCGLRSVASLHPRCGEGKIEEALLVAVDRDVLIYKESFPLHFSLSSIGDNEQPPTMEINYFFHPLFYELKEGRIEEALLVAVGRDVLVYKESALGLLELLYGDVSVDMWFEAPK
uniref:Uncharacterized protein n=1 Tax=Oryza nivara TaxID=4536 RepID=A0A0E0GT86_ORYNI